MITTGNFPFFRWVARTLTGRRARRISLAILSLVLLFVTVAQLRSYFLARKIKAVLRGLSEIRVDQTSEDQLMRMVPHLTQKDWKVGGVLRRGYYLKISSWLGYPYIGFDASVLIQDGKVTQVGYGLARVLGWPREATYIVSAKSVHGFWLRPPIPLGVSSTDDQSPQYRPVGDEKGLHVTYTNDAPSTLTERAFRLDLSCFWSLRGCNDAREIAPELWQDVQSIKAATYQQLISEKCPDSIIEGRMRYLPDVSVFLLEVTGSRRINVNQEGDNTEDWFTDYELKEVIRGQDSGSWKNIRFRRTIPSPKDPTREIANQIWPQTKIGTPVLFFGNPKFYSCRFIPATPSALEIVRKTPVPAKRPEDQIQWGLR